MLARPSAPTGGRLPRKEVFDPIPLFVSELCFGSVLDAVLVPPNRRPEHERQSHNQGLLSPRSQSNTYAEMFSEIVVLQLVLGTYRGGILEHVVSIEAEE